MIHDAFSYTAKKPLGAALIVVATFGFFLSGGLFSASVAHAQGASPLPGNIYTAGITVPDNSAATAGPAANSSSGTAAPDAGLSVSNSSSGDNFWSDPIAGSARLIEKATGFFLGLAGQALDFAIFVGVFQMGEIVKNTSAINVAWATIRDVANIGFIAVLIAIGVSTVLRIESYGAKKLLASLIVAALLVNFSLYFSKAIIDASNYLAVAIYTGSGLSNVGGAGGSRGATCSEGQTLQNGKCLVGISSVFMQNVNLQSAEKGGDLTQQQGDTTTTIFFGALFRALLYAVATYVFLSAALLILIRLVTLIFVMVLSPIGFVASVLPQTKKYAEQWWKALLGQSFFVPAYFLLLAMSFNIMQNIGNVILGGNSFAGVANGASVGYAILNFMIVVMFMIFSLTIAKDMGARGGKMVHGWGTKLVNGAKSGAIGAGKSTVGFFGRNSLGWAANALYESKTLKTLESAPIIGGLARVGGKVLLSGANAKFGSKYGYKEGTKKRMSSIDEERNRLGERAPVIRRKGESNESYDARVKAAQKGADDRKGRYTASQVWEAKLPGATTEQRRLAEKVIEDTQRKDRRKGDADADDKELEDSHQRQRDAALAAGATEKEIEELKGIHDQIMRLRSDARDTKKTEDERNRAQVDLQRWQRRAAQTENVIAARINTSIGTLSTALEDKQREHDRLSTTVADLNTRIATESDPEKQKALITLRDETQKTAGTLRDEIIEDRRTRDERAHHARIFTGSRGEDSSYGNESGYSAPQSSSPPPAAPPPPPASAPTKK